MTNVTIDIGNTIISFCMFKKINYLNIEEFLKIN